MANIVVLRDMDTKEIFTRLYPTQDQMFTEISRIYCFGDCDDTIQVEKIYTDGKEIEYVGWLPNMHYMYIDAKSREVVWEDYFPEWEH